MNICRYIYLYFHFCVTKLVDNHKHGVKLDWILVGFSLRCDCCLVWLLLDLRVFASAVCLRAMGRGLEETGWLVATESKSEISSIVPQGKFP